MQSHQDRQGLWDIPARLIPSVAECSVADLITGSYAFGAVDNRSVADPVCNSSIGPDSRIANSVVGPAIAGNGGVTDPVVGPAIGTAGGIANPVGSGAT